MAGIAPRLTRALVAWVLVIGLTALTVHPERCGRPIDDELAKTVIAQLIYLEREAPEPVAPCRWCVIIVIVNERLGVCTSEDRFAA